jgi:hypothetical protein
LAGEDGMSEGAANRAAEHLLLFAPMDKILQNLPFCEKEYHLTTTVIMTLMRAPDYADEFVRGCRIIQYERQAYNLMVNLFDDIQRNMRPLVSPRFLLSMQGLIAGKRHQLAQFNMPAYTKLGNVFFENMLNAGYKVDELVCYMTPLNLVAAADILNNYGYNLAPPKNNIVFTHLQQGLSEDQIQYYYEVIKNSRDALQAQIEMEVYLNGVGTRVLMSESELEAAVGGDLISYLNSAVNTLTVHKQMIVRVIKFLRQEDSLHRIDVLPKSAINKLMKESIINMDDLDKLPNAFNYFKREKLSHDLDI